MAENTTEEEMQKKIRRTRELLAGRFQADEITRLLDMTGWRIEEATALFLETDPKDLRELIGGDAVKIQSIRRDQVLKELALKNDVRPILRQFACGPCDNVWWYKVPARKPVSSCKKCTQKYDPIAFREEYGLAIFRCHCGNEFRGFGQKDKTWSECYKCGDLVLPFRVIAPSMRRRENTKFRHSCTGQGCYNQTPCSGGGNINGGTCTHPRSRQNKKVLVASKPHISTGSTVTTFLTQDNISVISSFDPELSSIKEDGDDA